MTWSAWADAQAREIRDGGRWRAPRDLDALGDEGRLAGGAAGTPPADSDRPIVSFASNDYLGLTAHPAVIAAAHEALDRWGAGSGSARLIVGSRPIHTELEAELAAWKQAQRSALFPTGFAANLGVLTTFGTAGTVVYSDELNHASIIDGCRLARADTAVYRHGDLDHLRDQLRNRSGRRALVVSDTVFSMDGDIADLVALVDLCAQEHALLVLDEAHAALGPHIEVAPGADVLRVGTCSKFLGSLGGFVAGPTRYVELIENLGRAYIFTTAPTPADTAATLAALRILRSAEGDALVARLRANVDRVREGHPSPIVPFVCGEADRAVAAAAAMLEHGLIVPAIRPPTVAPGTPTSTSTGCSARSPTCSEARRRSRRAGPTSDRARTIEGLIVAAARARRTHPRRADEHIRSRRGDRYRGRQDLRRGASRDDPS
jgi:7-keto-8-aminopelargonate synthetase-like enzyme